MVPAQIESPALTSGTFSGQSGSRPILRLARKAPVIEVKQSAEERELPLTAQDFDLHEVRELPSECLHALVKADNITLDLTAQQSFHVVVRELGLQFADGPGGIAKELPERGAHSGLRPCAFEQNAVEDLDLIKMIALRFKELAPLLDDRCHNRVVIFCEGYVGAVRFEQILVNVEAWAESFQSGFQPFYRILLLRAVEAFVVHAGNTEHHADIAGLRKKGRFVPETVEVDVIVETRAVLPGVDDFIDSQHHSTSTRGTCCFAAS